MTINATSPYRQVLPTDYSSFLEKSPLVPVGSSLSVMGALLVIARERFKGPVHESIPYVWARDINESADEQIEDVGVSSITIEVGTRDDVSHKDKRPAIYVDRGPISTNKLFMGDEVQVVRQIGLEMKHTHVNAPFRYVCRAKTRGAAEVIGNIMFEWLLYNVDIFRKYFQFHEIGPFSLGPEIYMQKQTDMFECAIDFRVAWDHRWSNAPIAQKLSQISLSIYAESTDGSPDTLLDRIAVSSLNNKIS